MPSHVNFYENLREAQMRLRKTVVMYDKEPYQVIAITNHKSDGIFRIYLWPVGSPYDNLYPAAIDGNYPSESSELGQALDKFLDDTPKTPMLRKQMNSPLFNKYRPFPLGMMNAGGRVYYIERQPTRKTEQGLTKSMLFETNINLNGGSANPRGPAGVTDMTSPFFRACILGEHPSGEESLAALLSGEYQNESVAFHRNFALLRGPLDIVFLAYKTDVIGVLPKNDFETLRIGKEYKHTREAIEALNLFKSIVI